MTAAGSRPRKSLQHRRAALAMHAKHGKAATLKARSEFLKRFERQVDPNGDLDPEERTWRAERARKAYMTELSERSAAVRKARRESAAHEPSQEVS